MLIHQGWFTALYTQHLLDSQSLEFEICIFPRVAIPSHYFPLREDSSRVLALGLHRLGNSVLAVVIIPPLPPNVTNSRAKPQQTPSVEKHAHSPRVVYCAIYPTLTRFTVSSLKFAYFQGRQSRHSRSFIMRIERLTICYRPP